MVNEADDSFKPSYVGSVVRTFLIFLDPPRAEHIRMCDVHDSGFMETFLQLANASEGQGQLCIKSLLAHQFDPPTTRDVVDEIFDMVQPQHLNHMTLDDLLKSQV
nr:hypothetical protein HmN_000805000 [Hymenolepis microstoma]